MFLSDGDWYGAFTKYLELTDAFLAQAETGMPYDYSNPYKTTADYVVFEIIAFLVAAAVAFIVAMILKFSMKTNVKNDDAADYVVPGSLRITESLDIFLHKTLNQTAKPKETSSSSGSGTHTSSSGTTHGGGGGKF